MKFHNAVVQCSSIPESFAQQRHERSIPADGVIASRALVSCSSSLSWKSSGGYILLNGKPFHLKGANWFGFETDTNVVHGLWGTTTMDKVLSFCKDNKINALRIPISLKLSLNPSARVPSGSCVECAGGLAFDVLNKLFDKAAEKGILIVLDMHRLNDQMQSQLWYDDQYSESQFIQGWLNLIERFGKKPNLMAIDLKNEPYGSATWNKNKETDWDAAAVRIVKAIKSKFSWFDKLIMVEGVGTGGAIPRHSSSDPASSMNWGQNLDGVSKKPIDFGSSELNGRLVYSPHVYGPSVSPQKHFNDPNFPNNMPAIWDKQVGFVEKETGKAVIVGEWGGKYTDKDKSWQDAWGKYMVSRCINDNFVWCLNPNSGDTGGLLKDDWTTPVWEKLSLMEKIQPKPSVFTSPIKSSQVCVDYGTFANSNCASGSSLFYDESLPSTPGAPGMPQVPVVNPPSSENCALAYKQCGGKNFSSKCCPSGYECTFHNIYWSGCDKMRSTPDIATITSESTSPPSSGQCSTPWSQCGGQNWKGNTCCSSGYSCKFINQNYSQCKRSDRKTDVLELNPPLPVQTPKPSHPVPEHTSKPSHPEKNGTPCPSKSHKPKKSESECASHLKQCGGAGFTGSTCCKHGMRCNYVDEQFSQCIHA